MKPTPKIINHLENEKNIWLATVRPHDRPHLIPIWFIWSQNLFFICTISTSVKSNNITLHPQVALALEDGSNPIICEGIAEEIPTPWPKLIIEKFQTKYDWNIQSDKEYDQLIQITPTKWLNW